jgi:hypothetical protein
MLVSNSNSKCVRNFCPFSANVFKKCKMRMATMRRRALEHAIGCELTIFACVRARAWLEFPIHCSHAAPSISGRLTSSKRHLCAQFEQTWRVYLRVCARTDCAGRARTHVHANWLLFHHMFHSCAPKVPPSACAQYEWVSSNVSNHLQ